MFKKIFILVFLSSFISSYMFADMSGSAKKMTSFMSAEKKIIKAKKLESKGKNKKAIKLYEEAFVFLQKANKENPIDADTLKFLGFTNLKLGNLEDAEIYYLIGLEVNPDHRGINEYLGELYVVTKRVHMAKKRLESLKNCNCEEYSMLKDVIEGTKKPN